MKKQRYMTAKNPDEISALLGIDSPADKALIEYRATLSSLAVKAIAASSMSVNEIVERSGVARSKVSAIKNGSLAGISSDLFLKVITAAGGKITIRLAG